VGEHNRPPRYRPPSARVQRGSPTTATRSAPVTATSPSRPAISTRCSPAWPSRGSSPRSRRPLDPPDGQGSL